MNWKFWKTEKKNGLESYLRPAKLPKPKDLPEPVGIYMIRQLKLDPDLIWSLKGALRPTADKQIFDIRIFDPKEAIFSDTRIANFNSLDNYPEMTLFEGSFNKHTGWIDLKRSASRAA